MIKQIFILVILFITCKAQPCTKGCLRCVRDLSGSSPVEKCEVPDLINLYYIDQTSKTIKKSDQTNCQRIDHSNICQECKSGYYIDSSTKKCVEVPLNKQIANCSNYVLDACQFCKQGYFLKENKCVEVAKKDMQCSRYILMNNEIKCQSCNKGFILSDLDNKCMQVPKIDHCQIFSFYQCHRCQSGHHLNRNLFQEMQKSSINQINQDPQQLTKLQNFIGDLHFQQNLTGQINFCQPIEIPFCKELLNFNECKVCNEGYVLNNNKNCVENPFPTINHCVRYSSLKHCSRCDNKFYLDSINNICLPSDHLENCLYYNSSQNSCYQCIIHYYLKQETVNNTTVQTCVLREIYPIENCPSYFIHFDKCHSCKNGYMKNSAMNKCIKKIADCKTQSFSSSNLDELICTQCNDNKKLSNNQCIPLDLNNCVKEIGGTCVQCLHNYYPTPSCDQTKPVISNCSQYTDSSSEFKCKTCQSNHFPFLIKKYCKTFDQIANCKEYFQQNEAALCKECEQGYILSSDKSICSQIKDASNNLIVDCATANGDQCTACFNNKSLNYANACVNPSENQLYSNCEVYEVNPSNYLRSTCSQCSANYVRLSLKDINMCITDMFKVEALPSSNLINNCMHHLMDNGQIKCTRCLDGTYLDLANNICINSCPGEINLMEFKGTPSSISRGSIFYNTCTTTATNTNVKYKAPEKDSTDLLNVTCKDYETNIMELSDFYDGTFMKFHMFNKQYTESPTDKKILSYLDLFKEEKCDKFIETPHLYKIDNIDNLIFDPNNITYNFQYSFYFLESSDITKTILYSRSCPHGKKITNIIDVSGVGFQGECNATCSDSSLYRNVPVGNAQLFSCHKCASNSSFQNMIPILIGQFNSSWKLEQYQQYDFSIDNFKTNHQSNGSNIMCISNSSPTSMVSSLLTNGDSSKLRPIPNCAMMILNTSLITLTSEINNLTYDNPIDTTPKTKQIGCVACLPGFKPVISMSMVVKCIEIPNCDVSSGSSNYLNICPKCSPGYIHEKHDYTKCVKPKFSSIQNCIEYDSSGNECFRCELGYSQTQQNQCEKLTSEKCQNSEYFYPINLDYRAQYQLQNGIDCNKGCLAGYFSIPKPDNFKFEPWNCFGSDLINNSSIPPEENQYILNCDSHSFNTTNNSLLCLKCKEGFLMYSQTKCVPESVNPNCEKLASYSYNCEKCKPGYQNLLIHNNKVCKQNEINNCKQFSLTYNNQSKQTCTQCNEGFQYNSQTRECEQGQIQHCKFYQNTQCIECNSGYWGFRTSSSNSFSKCIQADENMPCSKVRWNSTSFECEACPLKNQFLVAPVNFTPQNFCVKYEPVENCSIYNTQFHTSTTKQSCYTCAENYYLSYNTCIKRVNTIENCLYYYKYNDYCSTCMEGYIRGQNQKICIPYPVGIPHCKKYIDINNCEICENNYELKNNECKARDTTIQHCVEYNADATCKTCSEQFFLENNVCITPEVLNCKIYENKSSCTECQVGYVKVKSTANQDNHICQIFTIPLCLDIDYQNQKCLRCSQYYFPVEKECRRSLVEILNCEIYETENTCKKCFLNFILSRDRKSCIEDTLKFACEDAQYSEDMMCLGCKDQYELKGGKCELKKGLKLIENCMIQDTHGCQVCLPGFYQDKPHEKCLKDSTIVIINPVTPTTPKSSLLISIFILAVMNN